MYLSFTFLLLLKLLATFKGARSFKCLQIRLLYSVTVVANIFNAVTSLRISYALAKLILIIL